MKPASSIHAPEAPAAEMLPERRSVFDLRTVLAILGGVMLTVLMGLTVVDVIGRYVFNAPLKGASEMTELLLAAIIFMGLPAVSLADQHVTVDLVTDKLPNWIQPARKVLIGLFSAAILVLVGWRIWVYAAQIGGYGGSTTTLHIPLAPVGYFCAACTFVGAFLSLVVPVWHLVRSPKD